MLCYRLQTRNIRHLWEPCGSDSDVPALVIFALGFAHLILERSPFPPWDKSVRCQFPNYHRQPILGLLALSSGFKGPAVKSLSQKKKRGGGVIQSRRHLKKIHSS